MILLIGSEGNMGLRYRALLNHIKNDYAVYDGYYFDDYKCYDIKTCKEPLEFYAKDADSFIVATPTDTHVELIYKLMRYKKPILCEKPITKDVDELIILLKELENNGVPLTMVNQYAFTHSQMEGLNHSTYYNYFKHGVDGLEWDCINIIGLAKGEVMIAGNSPFWTCQINGRKLELSDIDGSYMRMLLDWLYKSALKGNAQYILHAHKKVREYAIASTSNSNRHSGTKHVLASAR